MKILDSAHIDMGAIDYAKKYWKSYEEMGGKYIPSMKVTKSQTRKNP